MDFAIPATRIFQFFVIVRLSVNPTWRNMIAHKPLLAVTLALLLSGCSCVDTNNSTNAPKDLNEMPNKDNPKESALGSGRMQVAMGDPMKEGSSKVAEAIVHVRPVKGGKPQGTVKFIRVPGGVRVVADITGLTPGKHGIHVHEHGDCGGDDASHAGAHFNPTNTKHGGPDSDERHVGDLGNVTADASGVAHYDYIDHVISLEGKNSIVGRSLVIHAGEDDFTTQPTGNSGGRIGCGVIEAVSSR